MAQEKRKPTVETVQQRVTVSDLLMYAVCTPIKEQLDKIKICSPHIVEPIKGTDCPPLRSYYEPFADPICPPLRSYREPCLPLEVCYPLRVYGEQCRPENECLPLKSYGGPCLPVRSYVATNVLRQKLLASDLEQLNEEVEKLKREIETLKRKG